MEHKVVGNIVEIAVDVVKIADGRYRKEMGDVESLAESIKTVGQLVPIIVSDDMTLIAGERRLRAHKLLEKPTIRAVVETREDINKQIIEILENLERKDFTWQEQVMAIEDLHMMMKAVQGSRWSMRKTAEKIGLSKSGVITDLDLAQALKEAPDMFERCDTKKKALKALQKYKIDETMAEITLRRSKTDYGKSAKNHVFLGDCLNLIDKLPDHIVNAVISDPFYGIDIDKSKKFNTDETNIPHIYDDSEKLYKDTMSVLISKLDRVMAKDSWVVFFCAIQHYYWLHEQLSKSGFHPDIIPAIWYKTGTSGQTNQPNTLFGRVYEPFIYAKRGDATLIKAGQPNVLQFPVVHSMNKDHPVEKPVSLLEEVIGRFCLPGHVILDPMCGSGSTLVAGIKRGCNPIGFELQEVNYNISINNVSEVLKMKDAGRMDLLNR